MKYCSMCGNDITILFNNDKRRKLCDLCHDWVKYPYASWND